MTSASYSEGGQTILDISGNDNHAINGLSLADESEDASPTDRGMEFSEGQFLTISSVSVSSIALSFEFYLSLHSPLSSSSQMILSNSDSSFQVSVTALSSLKLSVSLSSQTISGSDSSVDPTQWVHYAGSIMKATSSALFVHLFINGDHKIENAISIALIPSITSLTVGGSLNGSLLRLRLYDALVGRESFPHYAQNFPLPCAHGFFRQGDQCVTCDSNCNGCTNGDNSSCVDCALGTLAITSGNSTICYACSSIPGRYINDVGECVEMCGDGLRISDETECDDGNSRDNDGCSPDCRIEEGFFCEGGSPISRDSCAPIIDLRIDNVIASEELSLEVHLNQPVLFSDFSLSDMTFSSSTFNLSTSVLPSLRSSPLSGSLSLFTIDLNPFVTLYPENQFSLTLYNSHLSTNSSYLTIPPSLSASITLPLYEYVSPEVRAVISSSGSSMDYGSLLLMLGTSFAQFALQSSMEPLWALINLNQLIFLLPLLSFNFPKNANLVFEVLGFANGDMAAIEYLYSLSFEPFLASSTQDPPNQSYELLGYESTSLLSNSGIFLSFYALMFTALPIVAILKCIFKCKCFQKCASSFISGLLWNGLIRALIETFLQILLCAAINILQPHFNSITDYFSFGLSVALFLLYLVFPFHIIYIMTAPPLLQDQSKLKRLGELYAQLSIMRSSFVKYYFVFFLFHRLTFLYALFFLSAFPLLQLALMIVSSTFLGVYLMAMRPFLSKVDQFFSLLNSLFLVVLYLYCAIFLFIQDLDTRALLGLTLVGLIFGINGINFFALVSIKIHECRVKAREKKNQKPKELVRKPRAYEQNSASRLNISLTSFRQMPLCQATRPPSARLSINHSFIQQKTCETEDTRRPTWSSNKTYHKTRVSKFKLMAAPRMGE